MASRLPIVLIALTAAGGVGLAQRGPDLEFRPPITEPTYRPGAGPRIAIDGGHNNLHTIDGQYRPFATLLERDGYRVSGLTGPFTGDALRQIDGLVIANALGARGGPGAPAPDPAAFTPAEIVAVEGWVRDGGALLLIADHDPWPAAARTLAEAFGVELKNAYAYDGPRERPQASVIVYRKSEGTLAIDAITDGVESVATFLGSALRVSADHRPLLRLSPLAVARATLGDAPGTPEEPIGGWLQGAVLSHGRGRVGVFGEAAMFSAQVNGPARRPMGMNAPEAAGNARFVLNLMRWLTSRT